MITAILFLFIGLAMILLEFYVPGIIIGSIGGILVIASIAIFALYSSSALWISLYAIGVLVSVGVLIKFALWRIPRAHPGESIYLSSDQKGYQASKYDPEMIGKVGVVVTDMKPGGHILIEGKRHQALSLSGYLPSGTEVMVLKGQEESLIVKKLT